MSVDLRFGELIHVPADQSENGKAYYSVRWEPEPVEDDGTDAEYTLFKGKPHRAFSYADFRVWKDSFPAAWMLNAVAAKSKYSDDMYHIILVKDIALMIDELPLNGRPLTTDRHKWFQYWSRRALETFGDKAALSFWF